MGEGVRGGIRHVVRIPAAFVELRHAVRRRGPAPVCSKRDPGGGGGGGEGIDVCGGFRLTPPRPLPPLRVLDERRNELGELLAIPGVVWRGAPRAGRR